MRTMLRPWILSTQSHDGLILFAIGLLLVFDGMGNWGILEMKKKKTTKTKIKFVIRSLEVLTGFILLLFGIYRMYRY